ncbi:maleylpyruvate isomerase N-terminal domain-containing protein [Raineyella sp. LH-20]|uniref:maleylpyruvate isomerase N-terminal domain-containing protein n=1 Tax=Raineyella sp. LH-20 TaxID=3081204 RepID=UPI0029550556|nr:maleylpyruvate isomerase N-terminal domain-containing protein [Raineyella sp. LH-20]WOP17710.1 maleylpyruvate isomerase N-terminal domain-containing protein [Raineyella sp. LH-20]
MDARTWFTTAAAGYLQVVERIDRSALGDPGLGEWDVRSLLGHSARAFVTIESYLRPGPTTPPELSTAADYFIAVRATSADPQGIAERGRQAGIALGEDPVAAVRAIADRVIPLVERTPDDCLVECPFGTMWLKGYLPTRAFELTVHGIDLARATGQPVPAALVEATVPAIALGAAMAPAEQRIGLVLAMTGRSGLPSGFSVL